MSEILSIGELLDLGNSAATAGLVPYSALEYNGSGAISGISGSAIAGGVDSAVVSSIVSSYVESGISGKVDQSAFDDCCSAMSSVVSSKLDASASGQFAPSGDYYSASNPSGFITTTELSAYVAESSYSSFTSEVTNNITSISSTVSGLTGDYLEKSASSMFAPSGDYADASSLSSYIPYSAVAGESNQITSINGSAIAGGGGGGIDSATCSAIASAYAKSAASSKANSSSLSSYVPYSALKHGPTTATISAIGNSAVYDNSAHARINTLSTSRIPYSAIEYAAGTQKITGISGSAIIGGSLPTTELVVNPAQMSAAVSAGNIVIGLKTNVYTPVLIVQNSADATASNVIYVVTGNA